MKTITTVEELEALPEGAIVQDLDGGTYCKTGVVWTDVGYIRPIEFLAQELIRPGAVTLLHPLIFDDADVERAAKAAFVIRDDPYDTAEWDDLDSSDKELYYCQARAVLGAVGEVE